MPARTVAGAAHRPGHRWGMLAAVARERASEQSAKAASDSAAARPPLAHRADMMNIARVYEERAKAV